MKETEGNGIRTERRDAAENRQRILEAAIRLFEQYGVEQVSMNQIAIEAQIGPGTLYRRYRNKSELCLDLMKDNIVNLFDEIEFLLDEQRSAPPGLRLKGLIGHFIRFREKKRQLLAGLEESAVNNRAKNRTQGPLYTQLHEMLVALFDEISATLPTTAPDSSFKADIILTALASESYAIQRDVRGLTQDQIWEQLCLTFIPQA